MNTYKQKYKEAMSFLKDLRPHMSDYCKEKLDGFFPELKESEDERIRKKLISFVENWTIFNPNSPFDDYPIYTSDKSTVDKILAWLEKQGEQKPADKVESKFNVGDWITNGEYTWKVTDIKPLDYILQSPNGDVVDDAISYVDEHFHLWTIQDAKDGDVLVYEGEIFMIKSYVLWHKILYHCCYDGKNLHKHSIYDSWRKEDFDKVHPATKEQREFLFRKMHEEEYEWDAEKVITWIALHAELYGGFNQGKLNSMCEDLRKAMED